MRHALLYHLNAYSHGDPAWNPDMPHGRMKSSRERRRHNMTRTIPDKERTATVVSLEEAKAKGRVVISMKDDWKTVFPEAPK
jgi:hypothetical protein